MKKISMLLVVSFVTLIFAGTVVAKTTFLGIGTGGTGGIYYPYGGGVAEIWSKHVKGVKAVAEVTGTFVVAPPDVKIEIDTFYPRQHIAGLDLIGELFARHLANPGLDTDADAVPLDIADGTPLITTDGSTLLGADNKAGITEIICAVKYLMDNPESPRPNIRRNGTSVAKRPRLACSSATVGPTSQASSIPPKSPSLRRHFPASFAQWTHPTRVRIADKTSSKKTSSSTT